MKYFAELFTNLDQTTKTLIKIEALVAYFKVAPTNCGLLPSYPTGDLKEQ